MEKMLKESIKEYEFAKVKLLLAKQKLLSEIMSKIIEETKFMNLLDRKEYVQKFINSNDEITELRTEIFSLFEEFISYRNPKN